MALFHLLFLKRDLCVNCIAPLLSSLTHPISYWAHHLPRTSSSFFSHFYWMAILFKEAGSSLFPLLFKFLNVNSVYSALSESYKYYPFWTESSVGWGLGASSHGLSQQLIYTSILAIYAPYYESLILFNFFPCCWWPPRVLEHLFLKSQHV